METTKYPVTGDKIASAGNTDWGRIIMMLTQLT